MTITRIGPTHSIHRFKHNLSLKYKMYKLMVLRTGEDSIISYLNTCNKIIVTGSVRDSIITYLYIRRSDGLCCSLGPHHHLPQYLQCTSITTIDRLPGDVLKWTEKHIVENVFYSPLTPPGQLQIPLVSCIVLRLITITHLDTWRHWRLNPNERHFLLLKRYLQNFHGQYCGDGQ